MVRVRAEILLGLALGLGGKVDLPTLPNGRKNASGIKVRKLGLGLGYSILLGYCASNT